MLVRKILDKQTIQAQGGWRVLKFPAITEGNETHAVHTPYGQKMFRRHEGEALHPQREPLGVLAAMRETQGEYNFAGQYQQAPSPLGGGMIKTEWFKLYRPEELNGFVYVPPQADWLPQYLHEMAVFPSGKYDDQVDSTSHARCGNPASSKLSAITSIAVVKIGSQQRCNPCGLLWGQVPQFTEPSRRPIPI